MFIESVNREIFEMMKVKIGKVNTNFKDVCML